MRLALVIYFLAYHVPNIFSQCVFEPLTTQQEVDKFPQKYRNCKKFRQIVVTDSKGRINNLDSLKYIEELQIFQFVDSMNTIKDISGLDNIRKWGDISISTHKNYPSLKNMDSILKLALRTFKDSIDLRLFANVRYINRYIGLDSNIVLKGLKSFNSGDVFGIFVSNNYLKNSLYNIVPSNEIRKLELALFNVKNLTTEGIERAQKINQLFIGNVSHSDLNEVYNVPAMDTLIMIRMNDTLDYQQGFVNINGLIRLELDSINVGGELTTLLPSLRYVNQYISITNSSDIRNLDFLSKLSTPFELNPPVFFPPPYLRIENNPNLISCVNPFICKLLRTQPKRVILENNGAGCDRATILASCLTSTTDTGSDEGIVAYPNPFHEELTIPSNDHLSLMAIYNTAGQRMELDYLDKDRLDTSTWPTGMYIVQYLHVDKVQYYKVIK